MAQGKRIVACCDGTWVNSEKGYDAPTLQQPHTTLSIPTNVTRVYRSLKRRAFDGKIQVVYYHSGVGTSGSIVDALAGGIFGAGVSEDIREVYSFIATNYEYGDEIILVGFSRGAFTARSVAGLISEIGLLNSRGMEDLYPIFKDMQRMEGSHHRDKFPTKPFPNKPRHRKEYRNRLEYEGLTRVYDQDGIRIRVRCVAVWETVGSLGPLNNKYILSPSNREILTSSTCKFYNTSLSNGIEHAFQALALDEERTSFAPAIWERPRHVKTDLRQVWFCGVHSNVGGGLPDQELANVSLVWMVDQLASIGISFEEGLIDRIFDDNVCYYYDKADRNAEHAKHVTRWASKDIYHKHKPVRPWGLGELVQSVTGIYRLAGKTTRTPGMYRRIERDTTAPTDTFLARTNERIHRSVRIRLALGGLGFDDKELYSCRALLGHGWVVRRIFHDDPYVECDEYHWAWVYEGPEKYRPAKSMMLEAEIGPYEHRFIKLNKGEFTILELIYIYFFHC
ncbi:hypothetical protein N7495_002571 [Penicillium taxi]|uniref:uncharacterized protein n=1 Tax=Penicillium taxi TaxID=168475 RepID=UPI0025450E36|nr:uncharacterized protein N7495_002571 [Penicillium taxi]KAJ5902043.1 hypothetical protein N7495_002571 [Penicillium taxi]